MCDKKNYVLFTDSECLVLSPNFKLPDESQVLLKIPRQNNMYSFDMKNIVPKDGLTCLVAKATSEESMLWHRRLGIQEGESSISSQQDQDCIFMPIWKDASYFEDVTLQSVDDVQLQDQDGNHDDSSFQDEWLDGPIPTTEDSQEDELALIWGIFHIYAVSFHSSNKEFTRSSN
ncbi:hypothetical protein Tco_0969380 [Tanacetum coccineum]